MTLNKDQILVAATVTAIEEYVKQEDYKKLLPAEELRELMGLQQRIAHGRALSKYGVRNMSLNGKRTYRVSELLGLRGTLDAELPGWQGMSTDVPVPGKPKRSPGELAGVYVIYTDTDPGFYKIGASDKIVNRVKSLSTGSRLPFRFAAVVLSPNQVDMTPVKLESMVHAVAGPYRVSEGGGTEFFNFPNGSINGFLRNTLPDFKFNVLLLNGQTADELRVMIA